MKTRRFGNPEQFYDGGYPTQRVQSILKDIVFDRMRRLRWAKEQADLERERFEQTLAVGSTIRLRLPQRFMVA